MNFCISNAAFFHHGLVSQLPICSSLSKLCYECSNLACLCFGHGLKIGRKQNIHSDTVFVKRVFLATRIPPTAPQLKKAADSAYASHV